MGRSIHLPKPNPLNPSFGRKLNCNLRTYSASTKFAIPILPLCPLPQTLTAPSATAMAETNRGRERRRRTETTATNLTKSRHATAAAAAVVAGEEEDGESGRAATRVLFFLFFFPRWQVLCLEGPISALWPRLTGMDRDRKKVYRTPLRYGSSSAKQV